ncbi:MAG: ABC transporter permease [Candidatus Kapabacteria bacterium]|jgi:peptide/nickel transport system permease protein|nr:ABC transporter permease [Candidatus Kapabacteria bacterium]
MNKAPRPSSQEDLSETYGQFVRRQFRKHTLGVVSLWLVALLAGVAVFADFLANDKPIVCSLHGTWYAPVLKEYVVDAGLGQWDPAVLNADWKSLPYDWAVFPPVPYLPSTTNMNLVTLEDRSPSGAHYLGTDDIGRDVLSGLIHGSRYALSIGFIAMGIALVIGIVLGAIAGYFGGAVDVLVSRLVEVVITIPRFFLIITMAAMIEESSLWLVMMLIGLTGWTSVARFMRGEVLRVRNLDFVTSAQALGYGTSRIIFLHVLPNAIAPVLIYTAFGIVSTILLESSLSFLGFGVPETVVTWGSILFKARTSTYSWWLAIFPGLMIFLTVCAFNLIGDALRDATDPRLRS